MFKVFEHLPYLTRHIFISLILFANVFSASCIDLHLQLQWTSTDIIGGYCLI